MSIKVIAGDVENATWQFSGLLGACVMTCTSTREHLFKGETINLGQEIKSIDQVDEAEVKRLAGTAGWGFVGAALLGPLGAIGGMLLGGRGKEVCFACTLRDGRRFLATTDGKTWRKLLSSQF